MEDYLDLPFRAVLKSQSGSDYTCLQQLGLGGSAETYLCSPPWVRFEGNFSPSSYSAACPNRNGASFLDEIKFLKSCDHPAVMRVFDEGLYLDQHPIVVAEYLQHPGQRAEHGPADDAEDRIRDSAASALEYLALLQVSVVHRDIKPANIFIKGGSCVLGDFGLVKRTRVNPANDRSMVKESLGPGMPRTIARQT